jgi:hypothetical protein
MNAQEKAEALARHLRDIEVVKRRSVEIRARAAYNVQALINR